MARYVLAASPLAGHVMPMLGIAADLQRRGHDVTFMTGPQYRDAVGRLAIKFVALPEDAQPRPAPHRPSFLRPPALVGLWWSGHAEMHSVFVDPMEAQHRALQDVLSSEPVDAVLVDVAFTGALPLLLTDASRPPIVVCGVVPLMLSSVDTPPFGVGWQPWPDFGYGSMNWFVQHVLFADVQTRLNDGLRRVGANRSPVFLTDWPKLADRLLQLTVAGTEYPRRDLPSSVTFTGPVIAAPLVGAVGAGELPRALSRLKTTRTVVHVTQGTWDNHDHGQLIGPTLEALAGRDDVLVVATTGLPEQPSFAGPVPSNALVTDYVPYGSLLPYVDVMITNGGYGGVQHALAHGIPLIVAGRRADKPEVAARIDFIGAGIDLKTDRPAPRAIAEALRRISTTSSYRDVARRISRDMSVTTPFDTIAGALADLHGARFSQFGSHN